MVSEIDIKLEVLLDKFRSAETSISLLLADMPMANKRQRRELYLAVVAILTTLQEDVDYWAETELADVYRDAELTAIAQLEIAAIISESDYDVPGVADISDTLDLFQSEIRAATESVQSLAAAFQDGRGYGKFLDGPTRKAIAVAGVSAVVLSQAREQLRDNLPDQLVTIIGKDGKPYHFSLAHYVGISATHKLHQVMTDAALIKAAESNHDLIRVSPQPSTIGDYCDAYRGRVVSISGMSSVYPPLSSLPNGGAPFHPNCHHWMEIFYVGMPDPGPISQSFLEIGEASDPTPNDLQRLWKQVHRG